MTIKDESIHPYFVEMDENNYILKELCTVQEGDNKGKEYEQTIGYYLLLNQCINKIIKLKLARNESIVTLELFKESYNNFQKQILKAFKEI